MRRSQGLRRVVRPARLAAAADRRSGTSRLRRCPRGHAAPPSARPARRTGSRRPAAALTPGARAGCPPGRPPGTGCLPDTVRPGRPGRRQRRPGCRWLPRRCCCPRATALSPGHPVQTHPGCQRPAATRRPPARNGRPRKVRRPTSRAAQAGQPPPVWPRTLPRPRPRQRPRASGPPGGRARPSWPR